MTATGPTGPGFDPPVRHPWADLPLRLADLVIIVALAVGALLALRLFLTPREITSGLVISFLIRQNVALVAIICLIAVVWRRTPWHALGFVSPGGRWYRRVVPLALLVQVAVILTNVLISLALGEPFDNPQIALIMPDPGDWTAMVGILLATSLLAPFAEELALRAVLYGWLRRHAGPLLSALVSAMVFAMLHGSLILLPGTFLVGLVLAWVYERSGSLLPCILLHGCFNAISTLLVFAVAANA